MFVSTPKVRTLQGGTREKQPPHKTSTSAVSSEDIDGTLKGQSDDKPLVVDDLLGFSGKLYVVWLGRTCYTPMKLVGVYNSLSTASNAWTERSNCFWKGHDSVDKMFAHHKPLLRTIEYKYREILKQSTRRSYEGNERKRKGNVPGGHRPSSKKAAHRTSFTWDNMPS
eukprot:15355386-Ditylum_brightwellii.AAC.1